MPCRINHRRIWTHRLLLERVKHGDAAFVTLTYRDEVCPPELDKPEAQRWLKRVRRRMEPHRLRFFMVGEYGEETWRPHYHAALFGFPNCVRGRTDHRLIARGKSCCAPCDFLASTWPHGGVDCRELAEQTAQYLVGYVVKKMNREDRMPPGREELTPEFSRMSLKPGIGAWAMSDVASTYHTSKGARAISESGDVVFALRHGQQKWPLGRYLTAQLREAYGLDVEAAKDRYKRKRAQDLRALSESVGTAEAVASLKLGPELGRVIQTEKRAKLRDARRSI